MHFVSGKTAQHKTRLKELGGFWDNSYKVWRFRSINDHVKSELEKLAEISIKEHNPKPVTIKPREISAGEMVVSDKVKETVARLLERHDRKEKPTVKTNFYGNDDTFAEKFKTKNPVFFHGFESVDDLIDFIEAVPEKVTKNSERNQPWFQNMKHFYGTSSMKEAIKMYREGWSEGVKKAEEISEHISMNFAKNKSTISSVQGGRVNVGAMLAGNPKHMKRKSKVNKRKTITLFVDINALANIDQKNMTIKACVVCALCDLLENSGYSCEIVAVTANTTTGFNRTALNNTSVKLKSAGERLNKEDVCFALGHPSFLRRFHFALLSSTDEARNEWCSQGSTTEPFDELNENEVLIKHLTDEMQDELPSGNDKEKALAMFKMIAPEGLVQVS